MLTTVRLFKLASVAAAAVSLAACESSGSYRLASVGNVPDDTASVGSSEGDGTGSSGASSGGGSTASSGGSGGTGSSGSSGSSSASPLGASNILVTAGNAVIGVAGTTKQLSNGVLLPATGLVTGTVTKILRKTGQTLVDIGGGNTLILGKAGGAVGDLLRIDLGSHTVIGAPNKSALLGVGVLAPAGSGNLVAVSLNKALDVTASTTGGLLNSGLLTGATASTPAATTNAGAATTVTNTVSGVTSTLGGVVKGVTGGTTTGDGGLLGTRLLSSKKSK